MANIVLKEVMQNFVKNLSITVPKGPKRGRPTITDKNFLCPNYSQYNLLTDNNYKVKHLKEICRKYKQKVSGNKDELTFRLYNYLRLSNSLVIIQYRVRNFLLRKYNNAHGPACFNRTIFVKTYKNISEILDQCSHLTQSIGIEMEQRKLIDFAKKAAMKGVDRFPQLGSMTLYEVPWDGMYVMDRFLKWTKISSS